MGTFVLRPRRLGLDSGTAGTGVTALRLRLLLLPPSPWIAAANEADTPAFEELFRRMGRLGIEVDLLNPVSWPWNPLAGRHGLLQGIDPLRSLWVLLCGRRYDAVLTVTESPALLLTLLRPLLRFRPQIVATDVAIARGWRIRKWILDRVMPRLDGLVALDPSHVSFVRREWKCRAWMEVVPLHVDTDFFRPAGFVADGPILTVGDDIGRDYATLLRAIEGLDVALVAKTRRLTPEARADPRIQIVTERLLWRGLQNLYASARFVVVPLMPSVHASGVSSLLEAMAMGKAVIVSASPGVESYAVPDVTALVVPCGDAASLRSAITRLQSDETLCQRLGSAARAFAVETFGYVPAARRFVEVVGPHLATRGVGRASDEGSHLKSSQAPPGTG